MKGKRGLILIFILLFALSLVNAQVGQIDNVEKGYQCLSDSLGNNCGDTKNTEQAAFSLLAMGHDSGIKSDCRSSLNDKKQNNCFGKTKTDNCDIKSSAISLLALEKINENNKDIIDYLNSKKIKESKINWFLQIDSNNETECVINNQKIRIKDDKKISGTNPNGLKKAYNSYWFEIEDLNKNYSISCDRNFITALLYQKQGSDVFHLSSQTKSASAHDSISEKVNSFCFSNGNNCDYEGTLWSSLALLNAGEDISSYIPYLTAFSEDNENRKYIPSSFLYSLTGADDFYTNLIDLQKQGKFWQESSDKLYDTAIALLSLQEIGIDSVNSAKDYLLTLQNPDGCWSSDTALILYSGWPKQPATGSEGSGTANCESFGNYCVRVSDCPQTNTLENFFCPALSDVCCSQQPQQQSCTQKNGIICQSGFKCSSTEVLSSDTNFCCLSSCIELKTESECESQGFFCKDSCFTSQEEKSAYSNSCSLGEICCGDKPQSGFSWFTIILLILLIILIILAIIFRNRIKLWWFKFKNKISTKKTPPSQGRPNIGRPFPQRPYQGPPQRTFNPQRAQTRKPQNIGQKDKDFEETMKKLRDMSK